MKKVIVGAAMVLMVGGVSQHIGVNAQDITPPTAAQKPVNLNLQDMDIRDSLKLLFNGRSDVGLMVDPDVRGTVTRIIKAPSLDNALTQLLTGTGYSYVIQAGVYHVGARVIITASNAADVSSDGMITAQSQAQFTGPPFPPAGGAASPGMTGGGGFGVPGGSGFGAPGGGGFGTTTGGGFGSPGGIGFGGTTGGMPGGFGSGSGSPSGAAGSDTTDGGAGSDATTAKITLQKPIRVSHVAPEYIIALLRWLANSSQTQTGNGYGNQQQVNGFGGGQFGNNQFGGGQYGNNQYGNNQFGGGQFGGQSTSLNLPPTESDILGQELAQGSSSQQLYGLSATGGSGYGGQNGQYGNQYGGQNGQYGNQFGGQNGQFGNNQFGGGQFGNNQFGGGQFGNNQFGGQFGGGQFGNNQFGGGQFGGGYRGY